MNTQISKCNNHCFPLRMQVISFSVSSPIALPLSAPTPSLPSLISDFFPLCSEGPAACWAVLLDLWLKVKVRLQLCRCQAIRQCILGFVTLSNVLVWQAFLIITNQLLLLQHKRQMSLGWENSLRKWHSWFCIWMGRCLFNSLPENLGGAMPEFTIFYCLNCR